LSRLEDRAQGILAETGDANRRQHVHEFLRRALDAMAHVERSSIDPERWRYGVEKLRQESPATVPKNSSKAGAKSPIESP
jgi:hypothetical protein